MKFKKFDVVIFGCIFVIVLYIMRKEYIPAIIMVVTLMMAFDIRRTYES